MTNTVEQVSFKEVLDPQHFPPLPSTDKAKTRPLEINRQNFNLLRNEKFEVLQSPLLDPSLCDQITNELMPLLDPDDVSIYAPGIPIIGANLYNFSHDPEAYFARVQESNRVLREHVPGRTKAIQKAMSKLEEITGTTVSPIHCAKFNKDCFTGISRFTRYTYLHTDTLLLKSPPPWGFPKLKNQFAVNIFLTEVDAGGQCLVFNKPETPEDEPYRLPSSVSGYGYFPKVVDGAECRVIPPTKGSMTILCTENLHSVLPSHNSKRMTLSFFMGEIAESGKIALWC